MRSVHPSPSLRALFLGGGYENDLHLQCGNLRSLITHLNPSTRKEQFILNPSLRPVLRTMGVRWPVFSPARSLLHAPSLHRRAPRKWRSSILGKPEVEFSDVLFTQQPMRDGDLGYTANLKQHGAGEEPGQPLSYNLALAYPLFEKRRIPFFELNGVYVFAGEPQLKHKGQLYLSPGIRINPFGDVHGHEGLGQAHDHGNRGHPRYERLSLAVGAQFPVTAAKEYEWALTTSLKMEFSARA